MLIRNRFTFIVILALLTMSLPTRADTLKAVKVAENIYALVGPLGNRDKKNLGNNCNFGVIVSRDGVILLDSGGSYKGAASIHRQIQGITSKPVKLVINTGGQDHKWLGNGYFKQRGAKIIASSKAIADQKARFQSQYNTLSRLIGDKNLAGTEPVYADDQFDSNLDIDFDGTRLEISHAGQAHTPGDSFVWLPKQQIVFTGDIVYTERMLGILSYSNSKSWLGAFNAIAALKPRHVVPGHGNPTTLEVARKDTYDYILYLRSSITELIEAGIGIEKAGLLDQSQYAYLKNYDILKGRNAQRVYEEIEFE